MGLTKADVRALLDAFEDSSWQEMTVEVGGDRIHVSRRETNGHAKAPVVASPAAQPVVAEPTPAPVGPVPAPRPPVATGTPVVSPSVGLFWRAPSPDSPPFVDVGSQVAPEDTIGIVEVMKLMTPVPAGRAGTVSAVLADNGAMVEHGQTLVLISE